MLSWPLTDLMDAGRCRTALTQIQSVLIEVLTKLHLEKNNLAQKYWSVSCSLQHRLLKSQLISLASYQRKLMEILHKQMYLVTNYVTMKGKLPTQPSIYQQGNIREHQRPDLSFPIASIPKSLKHQEAHNCDQEAQHRERSGTQASVFTSPSGNNTQGMKAPLYTVNDKYKTCEGIPKQGTCNTLQHIKMARKKALIKSKTEDSMINLYQLIRGGVIPPGGTLQLFLKGHWHLAHVQADGSIMSKGKLYLDPKQWVQSFLGNSLPISSTYAHDKVMFRDKSLSYYILNTDAMERTSEKHLMADQHNNIGSAQEMLTETTSQNHQMKINTIHLVDDAELLPNATMDCYWDKILKTNYLLCAD
ncbi:uncharacterized protein LOC114441323 isoform X2 [Parambassis ranga]|nr:uncharacterized protein LOC114441323 isoform X2 [Parambassis ranga]